MKSVVIEINKDIDRYQESIALGLTAKQLVYSVASVAVGGTLVLLLYRYIGLTGSAYVAIPCVAPIALGGFYSYNGMDFYEFMGKKIHFMFGNRFLTYISTEGDIAIREFSQEVLVNINRKCVTNISKTDDNESDAQQSNKKQEEFEASKKKMKNMMMLLVVLIAAVVISVVTYNYMK